MSKPQLKSFRKNSYDEIKRLVASKYPVIWIESWEEERAEAVLKKIAASAFSQPVPLQTWSETRGFGDGQKTNVIEAIEKFLNDSGTGLMLIKDFSWNMASPTLLKRTIRDVFQMTKGSFKTLFLLSPKAEIPEDLLKEIITVDFALPDETDLQTIFDGVLKNAPKVKIGLNEEQKMKLLKGALGLTGDEAKLIFQKMLVGKNELNEDALNIIYEEKARIVKRDGLLDFVPTNIF
jgi:hypothetical protein